LLRWHLPLENLLPRSSSTTVLSHDTQRSKGDMSDEITFDDCCRIILEDWRWRQDGNVPELLRYKRESLALLNQEFDIKWSDEGLHRPSDDGLPALVSTMPRDYARLISPFACWMEYRMLPGEQVILDRHTTDLRASEMALKRHWVELFRDLLLLRWPEAVHRKTSWSRLHDLGLGEPPDEIDFCWLL
jgi:hypothetical protein